MWEPVSPTRGATRKAWHSISPTHDSVSPTKEARPKCGSPYLQMNGGIPNSRGHTEVCEYVSPSRGATAKRRVGVCVPIAEAMPKRRRPNPQIKGPRHTRGSPYPPLKGPQEKRGSTYHQLNTLYPQLKGPYRSVGVRIPKSRGHTKAWRSISPSPRATTKCGRRYPHLEGPQQRVGVCMPNASGQAKSVGVRVLGAGATSQVGMSISNSRVRIPNSRGHAKSVGVGIPHSKGHTKMWESDSPTQECVFTTQGAPAKCTSPYPRLERRGGPRAKPNAWESVAPTPGPGQKCESLNPPLKGRCRSVAFCVPNSRGHTEVWGPSPKLKGPHQSVGVRVPNSRGHAKSAEVCIHNSRGHTTSVGLPVPTQESVSPTQGATSKCDSLYTQLMGPYRNVAVGIKFRRPSQKRGSLYPVLKGPCQKRGSMYPQVKGQHRSVGVCISNSRGLAIGVGVRISNSGG